MRVTDTRLSGIEIVSIGKTFFELFKDYSSGGETENAIRKISNSSVL